MDVAIIQVVNSHKLLNNLAASIKEFKSAMDF